MSKVRKARQLRKNATDAESKIWKMLRNRHFSSFKFRRQEPLGRYIVDFVCYEKKIVVETDGGQHCERKGYDEKRTGWLNNKGFKVLRFWNNDVMKDFAAVKQVIWENLKSVPSPESSPTRGEETIIRNNVK